MPDVHFKCPHCSGDIVTDVPDVRSERRPHRRFRLICYVLAAAMVCLGLWGLERHVRAARLLRTLRDVEPVFQRQAKSLNRDAECARAALQRSQDRLNILTNRLAEIAAENAELNRNLDASRKDRVRESLPPLAAGTPKQTIHSAPSKTVSSCREDPWPAEPSVKLAVAHWHWSIDDEWIIVDGEVRNITRGNLRSVLAVASCYTANGSFVTSDSSLIDFNPVLPGQISPFQIYIVRNPLIAFVGIQFQELLGGTIPTSGNIKPTQPVSIRPAMDSPGTGMKPFQPKHFRRWRH
ncbi:MAG: hypothetical protein JXR37_09180 [Kiritimatiellae bacterium]|nr:hypothetical protein [Kiritimatiellia bacterium]